jgi:hypothetical protein
MLSQPNDVGFGSSPQAVDSQNWVTGGDGETYTANAIDKEKSAQSILSENLPGIKKSHGHKIKFHKKKDEEKKIATDDKDRDLDKNKTKKKTKSDNSSDE